MYNMPAVVPARTEEEVDKRVELWHSGAHNQPGLLHHYLGWSWVQYATWVMTNKLPEV